MFKKRRTWVRRFFCENIASRCVYTRHLQQKNAGMADRTIQGLPAKPLARHRFQSLQIILGNRIVWLNS